MQTDAEFCARVCRIAQEQGYTLDQMGPDDFRSYAFVRGKDERIAGTIQRDPETALVNACKELLRHIYLHLFQ